MVLEPVVRPVVNPVSRAIQSSMNGVFSPAILFTTGEQGAWYDPSDLTTLFQDSAGTTPVTAVEQPVGRILDKSGRGNNATQPTSASRPTLRARYNLLTYSEQFDNGAWTKTGATITSNSVTAPDGTLTADTFTSASADPNIRQAATASASTSYTGTVWLRVPSGTLSTRIQLFDNTGATLGAVLSVTVTTDWQQFSITRTTGASSTQVGIAIGGFGTLPNATLFYIWGAQLVSTAVFPSNTYQRIAAATDYATGAAFPPYLFFDGVDDSLLTNSVDFSAGATNPPLGSELVTNGNFSAGSTGWTVNPSWAITSQQAVATATSSSLHGGSVTSISGRWYRVEFDVISYTSGDLYITVGGNYSGNPMLTGAAMAAGRKTMYVLGGANTTRGVEFYGGTITCIIDNISVRELLDSSFAPDKMTVWAGVTKNSDAAVGALVELSADLNTNNGTFYIYSPANTGAAGDYYGSSKGTTGGAPTSVAIAALAPNTRVVTLIGNIGGPLTQLRVNQTTVTNTASQGTGNYGNYPLYIGRRNNATLPLNGNIYSLIIRGAQSTAAQISSTESWVAAKTPLGSL